MIHAFYTYREMFHAYNVLAPPGVPQPRELAKELEAKGYGYATEAGFNYTTPYLLTHKHLDHYAKGGWDLPTLQGHRKIFELGWPYNRAKVWKSVKSVLNVLLLTFGVLAFIATTQHKVCPSNRAIVCYLPVLPVLPYPTVPH